MLNDLVFLNILNYVNFVLITNFLDILIGGVNEFVQFVVGNKTGSVRIT
jgi:hypothetical protein